MFVSWKVLDIWLLGEALYSLLVAVLFLGLLFGVLLASFCCQRVMWFPLLTFLVISLFLFVGLFSCSFRAMVGAVLFLVAGCSVRVCFFCVWIVVFSVRACMPFLCVVPVLVLGLSVLVLCLVLMGLVWLFVFRGLFLQGFVGFVFFALGLSGVLVFPDVSSGVVCSVLVMFFIVCMFLLTVVEALFLLWGLAFPFLSRLWLGTAGVLGCLSFFQSVLFVVAFSCLFTLLNWALWCVL
ncbi:hypothetical protein [Ahrensia kielensis]|uniref:hypothetical protein n=1 Tax=Ahrensia kielensis TaxID=76980 RepID=UPI000366A6CD|nr:hypothetical protein [Ahrensia kielensis]